jgi:hypothetical protein
MMRPTAWFLMAVVLTGVSANGNDSIKKIRKIHLASNSAQVVSEITGTPGCVSLSESKESADATLDIQCDVDRTFRVVGIGLRRGKIIRATRKGWGCQAKLSPLSGNVIWAKSERGRTDRLPEDATEEEIENALDREYVQAAQKLLMKMTKAACVK